MSEVLFGKRIGTIRRLLRRNLEVAAAAHDITATQFQVLRRLWRGDGLSAQWLAKEADLDAATMTGVLDRLEDKGLLRRERDPADRRAVRVLLTPQGGNLEVPLRAKVQEINDAALKGLSGEERDQLFHFLDRIQANLENTEKVNHGGDSG